jgi:3-hydroxyacyl-CoA dehydrogenase
MTFTAWKTIFDSGARTRNGRTKQKDSRGCGIYFRFMSAAMAPDKAVRRIAIVGTGAIGSSWAALFLARGFDVIATDPDPGAEANLRHTIDSAWPALKALGISPKGSPEHLCFTPDIATAVSQADFIQESGPERKELKIRLLAEIDRAAPSDSIIASSSAELTMSQMQTACKHPERCVTGHPMNPPHIMPLVEVVAGAKTSPEAVGKAMAFYASIGKKPILLRKEVAGHAAARLEAALYREIAHLIGQGVLDAADADTAVCWGPGLRWGVMGPSVAQEVQNRSADELARERDEALLGLLRLRSKLSAPSRPSAKSTRGGKIHR